MTRYEIIEPDEGDSSVDKVAKLGPSTELKSHLLPLHRPKAVDKWTLNIVMWIEDHKRYGSAMQRINCAAMGYSCDSAKSKLQSAIKAFVDKDVFNPMVDWTTLVEIRHQYKIVEEDDGFIVIRPRRSANIKSNAVASNSAKFEIRVFEPYFEEMIIGFAALLASQKLVGGATIIGMLDPELRLRLESEFRRTFKQVKQNEHDML